MSENTTNAPQPKRKPETHGLRHLPEYGVWNQMKNRCLNTKVKGYAAYGGRGIMFCDAWHSFTQFYADMGPRPSATYQLERKDNDGPYCPDNCVWATRVEQCNNRRSSRLVEINGVTHTLAEWSRISGVRAGCIDKRLRRGVPTSDVLALSLPKRMPYGETHGNARLTDAKVLEMRARYAAGTSMPTLARDYGVAEGTIGFVVKRLTWKHI